MISVADSEAAIGVMALFLRRISAQLHVVHKDPKAHAILAWTALWDVSLLSALFDCEVACNFQCDTPAEELANDSNLRVTNYHLRGIEEPRTITESDSAWLGENFASARELVKKLALENAVHCLASYRQHQHPRTRLALIWSGIEGLFGVKTELSFRLSL